MEQEAKSFTFVYGEECRLLGIPVTVEYVDTEGFIQRKSLDALIDTGATNCGIDRKLAKEFRFTTVGVTKQFTAGGIVPSDRHTVNIVLPSEMRFDNEEITEIDAGVDFVIGMSVLKKGDFMLSHLDGNMVFSFRVPPVGDGNTYRTRERPSVSMGKRLC